MSSKVVFAILFVLLFSFEAVKGQLPAVRPGSPSHQRLVRDSVSRLEEEKKEKELKERKKELGENLFGKDERWMQGQFAGTLRRKRPGDFQVGDWGSTDVSFSVLNTLNDNECLVISNDRSHTAFLLRGRDMSRIARNHSFIIQRLVSVNDTYQYQSRSGPATALVLNIGEDAINQKLEELEEEKKAEEEAKRRKEEEELAREEEERKRQEEARTRTWVSADGQFQVKATFLSFMVGNVRLKREDGQEITVSIEQLSEDCQDFIRGRRWVSSD